jgi:hypothetical protein
MMLKEAHMEYEQDTPARRSEDVWEILDVVTRWLLSAMPVGLLFVAALGIDVSLLLGRVGLVWLLVLGFRLCFFAHPFE